MRYIADTAGSQIEEPAIVTLGKFNGKYRGHQKLLRTMVELKAGIECPATISILGAAPGTAATGQPRTVITTDSERRANMEKVGIDYLVEYLFTDEIRHMELEASVRDILTSRMHTREIVIGLDCGSGYKRTGSAALLLAMAHDPGYCLRVIGKGEDHKRDISSTYIREELEEGNVERANQPLGQPYIIHGEVMHDNHIGNSLLGFPTVDVLPSPIKHLPRYGVYVSHVLVDGVCYRDVTNIGKKPTVGGKYPAGAETYIFDLEDDTYDKNIEIQIPAFDRPKQKLTFPRELKERIEKDKEFVNAYYEEHPEILVEK